MSALGQRLPAQHQRRVAFLPGVPLHFKALRKKDYSEMPQTLGEHLKKRRREQGLLQREAAVMMGVVVGTLINWEKHRTKPVAAQFRPLADFLGYDPTPAPTTLVERVEAKRRQLGVTLEQVARYLGWDAGSLTRYLNGTWRLSPKRADTLEQFLDLDAEAAAAVLAMARRKR